jgi:nucleoside-diphosphate-sugar epimerase
MKILITGGSGFIATHLSKFYEKDYEIIKTSRDDSSRIGEILLKEEPELIFHCGAEIYDNDKMFESNILLTYNILEHCKTSKNLKKLVILGSSSEYGRKSNPMSENDVLNPETIYEGTKSACTMLASAYSNTYNINILLIRPFTIYGKGEKSRKFIQILLNKKQTGDKKVRISSGMHDYVYIDDFIEAFDVILNNDTKKLFDIINIGTGVQTSNMDVMRIFETVADYKFDEIEYIEHKTYDSNNWVCDSKKLNNYYHYKCEITLEEGLRKMIYDL